ncbi:4-coumarate--CoA ligase-like 9 [Homalodisca vitripennis]|uniref:4-coumarate--CoA ligase-like 9 n=1 Tax=Homalodisca vitripennis TaxID=197043 RepID=UPI001EECC76E|nr:4-coumarate--CoA ligase-like 9 [Homalodisca vitripennis]XP_046664230.1 4-coumarate--CoA ligase-like 9 [Homalodisca vitripennis]
MSRGRLGRLETCWRSLSRPPVCRLHSQHPCLRLSVSSQQCRYTSHIVRSPFPDIEIPNKLIPEMIWEIVDRFPESTAIKCGLTGRSYTFAQIHRLSLRFANSLRKAGFTRGDVIALVLSNSPEFPIITLGALEADLSLSFVNHSYTPDEMTHQLKDSGSVCVIVGTEQLEVVLSSIDKVEKATHSKPFRRVIVVDTSPAESLPPGVSRFSELVADGVDQSAKSGYQTQSTDMALLPYSSGTTGLSKGVCLSHRNILCNILQMSSTGECGKIRSPEQGQDILLGLLPFYHIYGLVVILLNGLLHGGQVITLPKFEQESFVRTLENDKVIHSEH